MENELGRRGKRLSRAQYEVGFFETGSGVLVVGFGLGLVAFAIVVFSIMQFHLLVMLLTMLVFTLFIIMALAFLVVGAYLVIRFVVRPMVYTIQEIRGEHYESQPYIEAHRAEIGPYAEESQGVHLIIDGLSDMPDEPAMEETEEIVISEADWSQYCEPVRMMVANRKSKTEIIWALWGVRSGRKYQEASRIFDGILSGAYNG